MVKLIKQTGIILLVCLAGEFLSRLIGGWIPGNVIGMALLFALLCCGVVRLEHVEHAADFLFANMTLFLIPAMVGLISTFDAIAHSFALFVTVCAASSVAVLLVTGHIVRLCQYLQRRRGGGDGGAEHE